MRHIMLDIETLGTTPGAPILQIGALRFSPSGVPPLLKPSPQVAKNTADADVFFRNITLKSNFDLGLLEITQGAIEFWLTESRETAAGLFKGAVPIRQALSDLWKWVDMEDYDGIWAHGASFDMPILSEAYYASYQQERVPWRYRAIRDTRTLFSVAFPDEKLPEPPGVIEKHNALMDSYRQAYVVQKAYSRLRRGQQ